MAGSEGVVTEHMAGDRGRFHSLLMYLPVIPTPLLLWQALTLTASSGLIVFGFTCRYCELCSWNGDVGRVPPPSHLNR